jgi:D-arabinose 1-dehydrogenase-like Zn-dependent alcohol dehydrogenase
MDMAADGQYTAVTAVASLHHIPLTEALSQMRSLLAPGGRLVIIGCYELTPADHLVELIASPANMIMGLLKSANAREARIAMSARTAVPQHTLAEIRQAATRVLPGARIRKQAAVG